MKDTPWTGRAVSPPAVRNPVLSAIDADADVEAELAHLESSADPADDDEPGSEFLATRLRSLRDATRAPEQERAGMPFGCHAGHRCAIDRTTSPSRRRTDEKPSRTSRPERNADHHAARCDPRWA